MSCIHADAHAQEVGNKGDIGALTQHPGTAQWECDIASRDWTHNGIKQFVFKKQDGVLRSDGRFEQTLCGIWCR